MQIRNFGFTSQQSLLYGVPGGAVEVISLLASGYVGHITCECLMSSLGGQVAAIVGMVLIVALPLSDNTGRLIGYYMTQANATGFVALLFLISSNVAGYTKKTTVAALYLIGYCTGNIIGEARVDPVAIDKEGNGWLANVERLNEYRPSDIPPQRRTALCPCRDHDYRLLGRLLFDPCSYTVLVPQGE